MLWIDCEAAEETIVGQFPRLAAARENWPELRAWRKRPVLTRSGDLRDRQRGAWALVAGPSA